MVRYRFAQTPLSRKPKPLSVPVVNTIKIEIKDVWAVDFIPRPSKSRIAITPAAAVMARAGINRTK